MKQQGSSLKVIVNLIDKKKEMKLYEVREEEVELRE